MKFNHHKQTLELTVEPLDSAVVFHNDGSISAYFPDLPAEAAINESMYKAGIVVRLFNTTDEETFQILMRLIEKLKEDADGYHPSN